jgi:S-methylmethionine-dependent homocysteine/selenocysteine methylase
MADDSSKKILGRAIRCATREDPPWAKAESATMSKYRTQLPQLGGKLFLTDGGIETTLIFLEGFELPHFAAFDLLKRKDGRDALRRYFEGYIEIARSAGHGFILESPTWRASSDWGDKLGYSKAALANANEQSIALMKELRDTFENDRTRMVISGCVGPRGDGYDPGTIMTPEEAECYHAAQIDTFVSAGADMVTAISMTNSNEAVGVTRAARKAAIPVAISFTVETDGRLPTGQNLKDAIEEVDGATGNGPVYYMINCAHPSHFADTLTGGDRWLQRIRGLRANASTLSHAELNEATELDAGDPLELSRQYRDLLRQCSHINVLGGCCGTDHRHLECISNACKA